MVSEVECLSYRCYFCLVEAYCGISQSVWGIKILINSALFFMSKGLFRVKIIYGVDKVHTFIFGENRGFV